jgi:hypothetical protein
MAKDSLARSGKESTDKSVERGRQLFREHCLQFRHEGGAWLVPSNDAVVDFYRVRLGPAEVCECAVFKHRGEPCKHIYSARTAHAKSSLCSCCGHRVLNRFLSEVVEEDELLGWFVGDMLCADCIKAGYWS